MAKNLRRWPAIGLSCVVVAVGVAALQAQRLPDMTREKSSDALRSIFQSASAQANQSTVSIKMEEGGTVRQIAMGTIVSDDGFILTKASEVLKRPKIWVPLMTGSTMRNYDVKIVGVSPALDLAMLKIDARGLTPVIFADTRPGVPDAPPPPPPPVADAGSGGGTGFAGGPGPGPGTGRGGGGGGGGRGRGGGRNGFGGGRGRGRGGPATAVLMPTATTQPSPPPGAIPVVVGEWVASASSEAMLKADAFHEPYAVGVISTVRRRIAPQTGFLGVQMNQVSDGTGTKIDSVQSGSPADKAGVKADDVITAVNGMATPDLNVLRTTIQKFGPGESVTLTVVRGSQTLTLRAALSLMSSTDDPELQHALVGDVNLRSGDFPAVFQHDTVIRAIDCGGPIVDLDGHVLGINIARAGRTETYAIPADLILPLIQPLESGKMAPGAGKPNSGH